MSVLLQEVRAQRHWTRRRARAVREAASVSRERLAAELGVHVATVTRWELGMTKPRPAQREAWYGLLDGLEEALG